MSNKFFPRGAIASFLALLVGYAALWYALYFIALARLKRIILQEKVESWTEPRG